MDLERLHQEILNDEGMRHKPYSDVKGNITIGIGRNLTQVGLRDSEIQVLYNNDIADVLSNLNTTLPWWQLLDDVRQRALVNITFNLGITNLLTFKKMLTHLRAHRYDEAAAELLSSKAAREAPKRYARIAYIITNGRTEQDL
jgi:lysozyme